MNDDILALAVFNDGRGEALYAGGNFATLHDGDGVRHLAKWDGNTWSALGAGMSADGEGVRALAPSYGGAVPALYIGGRGMINPAGDSARYIVKWDGVNWSALGTGLNGAANELVAFNDGSGEAMYVGGQFTTAGSMPAIGRAKWQITCGPPFYPNKSRFISFMAPPPTEPGISAIRVTLSSLHHVQPPYTNGESIPFSSFEGQVRWVGPPVQYVESTSNSTSFYASTLQCSPHYQDWSTLGLGIFHVTGSAIVPSSEYAVESLAMSCMGIEGNCTAVSTPLAISTTRWGDVETPYNPSDVTAQPDVGDISAMVTKFRSAWAAPNKVRMLLAGDDAFGNFTTIDQDLGFRHIAACVDAFKGRPYPHMIQSCP